LIDATAVIGAGAEVADDVSIGPYSVVGANVVIGTGTRIGPHVVITGHTRIGRDNTVYQFASIGAAPQDKKYDGEPTRLEIGDRNTIREFVTVNRGTVQDEGVTRLGDDNWIMAYVHIAHDCQIGNQTIFANNASLAGHVTIGDYVMLGGFTLVHQFCSLGQHSLTAFPASPHGMNMEGLRRRGFSAETRKVLKQAYRTLYRENLSLQEAITRLKGRADQNPELGVLVSFLENQTRGIVR